MIQLAGEELDHCHRVYQELAARGLQLGADTKDLYVSGMRDQIRRGPAFYLMDRLLVAGVVEARGCERFGMVAQALPPGAIKELYETLSRSEAHHHQLFIGLALRYFAAEVVEDRLTELLEVVADLASQCP